MTKRTLLAALLVALPAASAAAASGKLHGDFPNRPIRIVDQYGPGGATDVMARVVGTKLTERYGQQVLVDNRPGVAGNLAAQIVQKSSPDGHTMLIGVLTDLAASPLLYPHMAVNPLRDFAFITPAAAGSYVMVVNPTFPAKSVADLVAAAKKTPGKLTYGSGGVGSALHLACELLKSRAGINLLHVPYKGGAAAIMAATTAGEIHVGFASIPGATPFITTNRVLPLAVTSAKRSKSLPTVPTLAESGYPGYDLTPWYGFVAPAATPPGLVQALSKEIGSILQLPDVQTTFGNLGLEAQGTTPERFREIMKSDVTLVTKIIKDADIKPPQ